MVLILEFMEPLGVRTLLDVCQWGWGLKLYNLALLPVLFHLSSYILCLDENVINQIFDPIRMVFLFPCFPGHSDPVPLKLKGRQKPFSP